MILQTAQPDLKKKKTRLFEGSALHYLKTLKLSLPLSRTFFRLVKKPSLFSQKIPAINFLEEEIQSPPLQADSLKLLKRLIDISILLFRVFLITPLVKIFK